MEITRQMIEDKASEVELWEDGYKGFINGAEWALRQAAAVPTQCDVCGFTPSTIIRTEFGTFCTDHAKYVK